MSSGQLAVDIDLGVHISAFEVKEFFAGGDAVLEGFPVPAKAGGVEAAGVAGGGVPVRHGLDAPVVREVQCAPGGIVKAGIGRLLRSVQLKFPA